MNEFQIYGKDGLFHNIAKASAIIGGRYAILPNGPSDLNANNVLSGIDLPKDKYPLIACLPPVSTLPGTTQSNNGERFIFRLLFLAKSFYSGDNKIKSADPATNTSLHTIPMDWNDMKIVAMGFMNALEQMVPSLNGQFYPEQKSQWVISRISDKQSDGVSGVMVSFSGFLSVACEFTDINTDAIIIPTAEHNPHYH